MQIIDKTIISVAEPGSTRVLWVTPTDNDYEELKVFIDGRWKAVGSSDNTAYHKPEDGIPDTDLSQDVQTSLGKADSALQTIKTINGQSLLGSGNIVTTEETVVFDGTPTQGSINGVTSGGVASEIVWDVTARNSNATFASLSALLSNANLSTLIPTSVRKGGMQIRFVCSSDNNYVQYFLTKDEWSANADDWEKVNLEKEVDHLDGQINGSNAETAIEATYSNGYILGSNGVIAGTSSSTYQHTDAIALTDDMVSLKCFALLSDSAAGGVGFYKSNVLPTSTAAANDRTVEVVGVHTGSVSNANEIINISAEKIADLKSRGATHFSVCILSAGQKGISYFTPQEGLVDKIHAIEETLDDFREDIEAVENSVEVVENGVIVESEVSDSEFEYGYITTNGKFPNPGTNTTFSRTSPTLIGDVIGIRAKVQSNSADGGGIFFFSTNNKPATGTGNPALVGVIGHNTSSTSGYVNDEVVVTREQIRQMQALGAKYFAVSSYTEGRALYTSVVTKDGLEQTQEKVENLEQVTQTCRKRMDITFQDTPVEILNKLIQVYDGNDYDVYWENGTYDLSNAWTTMITMNRFNAIGTWELPIGGKNNRYYFNGSIISASGLYDLIGETKASNSNLFGTLRHGNHFYELYDATFIISDGNYCFHDETSSDLGCQVHRYHNIKFINRPTEHSSWIHTGFALGNGQNMTILLENCYFDNTDGEPCVRNHGMEHTGDTAPISNTRVIFSNNYFNTAVNMGNLDLNENCDFVFNGNSYTTLFISENGQGVYTRYIFCNEQRS